MLIFPAAQSQPVASGPDAQAAESEVALPAPAQKNHLLPFYVSPTTTMDFAIDAKSLSVTPDGIVRFTLVVTSRTGATNTSYEGIRCATEEKKLYATGKPDGGWSPSRRDVWSPIGDVGANRQHAALMKDYFCEGTTVAGKAEAIIERIRKQKPLK
ncbi:MAG: CNP1-like family protein [Oxalobacteraceae bacterium]